MSEFDRDTEGFSLQEEMDLTSVEDAWFGDESRWHDPAVWDEWPEAVA